MPGTMTETSNVLLNPSGPEYQFLVGEGLYVLKEDLHLAIPPPHPSEAPMVNPNPLSTAPQPATAGTRLSLINLDVAPISSAFYRTSSRSDGAQGSIPEHPDESKSSSDVRESSSEAGRVTSSDGPLFTSNPAFGEGNTLLAPMAQKDANKRRKPKNNMSKSNSSFISRVINHDSLNKRLQDRAKDGLFGFANINRAFQWLDLSSPTKAEYLTKILFTKAHCLCHDVNMVTKSPTHIDVVMGFSTGEIIWWEPISQRYTRLNKNGIVNGTPVSEIKWIPGSENLFLASHMDGTLIVYDKEKEDGFFSPEDEAATSQTSGDTANDTAPVNHLCQIQVNKSVHSKTQKANPVAVWKLSNQRINAFAFSPDSRHLAVYVVTGGQDDLLSVWCPSEEAEASASASAPASASASAPAPALVARGQGGGHRSWVTSVAFDPWRCDERSYRFGSVGEDCRVCLWDFSVGMLHRPRAASVRHRASVSSRPGFVPLQRAETAATSGTGGTVRLRSDSNLSAAGVAPEENGDGERDTVVVPHPVEPRATTAMLPPVLVFVLVAWWPGWANGITGHIRTWNRPSELTPQLEENVDG
ncbi:hypothetical protein BT67DRAFT_449222 [Trichocladium antarcticum]|uniref:Catabolite repression protein creC n=1 Tax=Trichocladium antarcticum TaxID=1450529 RepID=A0AAN6ZEI0_9PEZI|nr:hypothetical protein BT67DRAFT_449222 [Trichocladium antarcticum]